jgi:predicted nucleotidyltransferase
VVRKTGMRDAAKAAVLAATGLADACGAVLGRSLVSVILHGSLVTDDFKPGLSDLDLLIVVERGLAREEADALIRAVREADLGTAAGVDVLVVTRRTAMSPWISPALELSVGHWPLHSAGAEVVLQDDLSADLCRNFQKPERTGGRSWARTHARRSEKFHSSLCGVTGQAG